MNRGARMIPPLATAALALVARAGTYDNGYTADASAGQIVFIGMQAGAPFKGTFRAFTAKVDFAPQALTSARFDVQISLDSLDTGDKDRDKTMRGADIFDVAHFPTAHYVARSFTKTSAGYRASGSLTLHGTTKEVPVDFQFLEGSGSPRLVGSALLKRLDFGVGQGDWKSTQWIGDIVKVNFALTLKVTR